MGGRMSTVIKAKINKLLDKAEDPAETLEYSYAEADGAAAERQEGHRRRRHGQEAPAAPAAEARAAGRQARHAGAPGARRRAARTSRAPRSSASSSRRPSCSRSTSRSPELESQQQQLVDKEQKLRSKLEQFRTKKEVIKAQYSAAEAQVKISEAATGVGEEMADVGMAMQRAMDKTEGMRARASAMEELEAAGAFDDNLTLTAGQDDIDRQLHELTSSQPGRRRPRQAARRSSARARAAPAPRARPRRPASRSSSRRSRAASVIVRIATEGQYELPDEDADRLNELDNDAVDGGRGRRRGALPCGLRRDARARPHATARPLADDELEESDVILPPPDLTFDEARRHEFTGRRV